MDHFTKLFTILYSLSCFTLWHIPVIGRVVVGDRDIQSKNLRWSYKLCKQYIREPVYITNMFVRFIHTYNQTCVWDTYKNIYIVYISM